MNENNFSNFEPVMESQPAPKKSNKTPIIIVILSLLLMLAVGYIVYDNFIAKDSTNNTNNNTNNEKEDDTDKENEPSNLSEALIEATKTKVGTLFFWIKEDKIDNIDNIDNDMKLCLAMKTINQNNPLLETYSEAQMNDAIRAIIPNATLVHGTPASSYGMECFIAFSRRYHVDDKAYYLQGIGHEGEIPILLSKLTKTDFDGKYYNFYYQTIYREEPKTVNGEVFGNVYFDSTFTKILAKFETTMGDFDYVFKETSTEGKQLEDYLSLGSKHKLSFELKDNILYWVKYEKID